MARRKLFYEQHVVAQALKMLEDLTKSGPSMGNPDVVANWFRLRLAGVEHEEFGAAFLDSQNRVLGYEVLFRGTLSQTSVYPREIVKAALRWNAAAVIFAHNHPSGVPSPSSADEHLTQTLRSALALVDVRVLDHFVVTTSGSTSFAQLGLI